MNHPEVFIIPVLMLLDYFLTVWGSILRGKKHAQHFRFEHYELNPIWQKSIAQKKWLNPGLLGIVTAVTAICFVWSVAWKGEDDFAQGALGFVTVLYGSIVGRHLENICAFRFLFLHPECVSGEVTMSHLLALHMAQFHCIALCLLLVLIAIFSPSPFLIGGVLSQVYLFFLHWKWIKKTKAQLRKADPF
jgi:hypothetical protein